MTCFPACPMRLSSRFSHLVVFLVRSDVLTFSAVFNGLTVTSTVTFGGVESASCGLLCTSGCAIRCQTLVIASLLPPDCAGRTPGKPWPSAHELLVSGRSLSPVRPKGAPLPSSSLCWCSYQKARGCRLFRKCYHHCSLPGSSALTWDFRRNCRKISLFIVSIEKVRKEPQGCPRP